MKNRLISLLLCVTMLVSMLPASFAAAEAEEEIIEEPIIDEIVTEDINPDPEEAEDADRQEEPGEEPAEEPPADQTEENIPAEEPVAGDETATPEEETPAAEEAAGEELPASEEPADTIEEPVIEEEIIDEIFQEGYARVKADTIVFRKASKKEVAGRFTDDAVVYAELVKENADQNRSWYRIAFNADGLTMAYLQYKSIEVIGEEESAELKTVEDTCAYKGYPLPAAVFAKAEEPQEETEEKPQDKDLLSDGNWLYRIVDGYAEAAGYLDKTVTALTIPDQLGGYFVNAIGAGAFADLEGLAMVRVHGNVIAIRDGAFASKNVTLQGYNGTTVLAWARENGYPYQNLTNNPYFEFQDQVIDYSYADNRRYEYVNASTIRMRPAEAAQLAVGSMFYEPIVFGDLACIYKVKGLQSRGEWVYISVTEAKQDESLTRFHASDDNMQPDWSRAEWEDGVVVSQEKWSSSFTGTLVDITYTKDLGQHKTQVPGADNVMKYGSTNVQFFVNFNLGFKASADIDYEIHLFRANELHKLDLTVEPSVTIKTGFKFPLYDDKDNIPYNGKNWYSKSKTKEMVKPAEYSIKIGSVPIVSFSKVIEVRAAVYIRITAKGEVEIVIKGSGKLGLKWNESKKQFDKVKGWTWQPPSISGAVEVSFGPVEALELHVAILGRVIAVELFEGVVLKFTVDAFFGGSSGESVAGTSYEQEKDAGICANVRADIKVTLDFKITQDFLADILKGLKIKVGFTWDLISINWFEKHWELGRGLMDKCTYSNDFKVEFYTGTGEDVDAQTVKGGVKLKEPQLTNVPGTLLGWYQNKKYTGDPWDFANDKVMKQMTLYAKWDIPSFTVKYKCNYDGEDFEETANQGAKLKEPDKLRRLDYRFDGWYKEKELNNKWDFANDTMPGNDITLYAKWNSEPGYDPFQEDYITDGHGDVVFSGNGHSYTHIMEYKSYQEAAAHAARVGGYLATINSEAEQQFLAQYLYQDCAQQYLWLGMVSQDGWDHWATGEKVTYSNWNSIPATTSTQFNAALIRTSGKWTTLSNTQTAHYVIEWGAPDIDPDYGKNTKQDDNVRYTVDASQQAAYVVGWNNDAEELTISNWYNGYEVKGIVNEAFKGNTTVKRINIPNTVTSIGNNAFMNCLALEEITIPNSVTSIGTSVLENCASLKSVQWSSRLTEIPYRTFYDNTNMKSVTGTDNVTKVGERAFYYCMAYTGGVPINAETIGTYAYYLCPSMPSILLPESVKQVDNFAFQNCRGAKTITISEKMTSIPYCGFYDCFQAETINIPSSITSIGNSAFYNVNGTFRVYAGSYAENWCKTNNKKYTYIDGKYRVVYAMNGQQGNQKDGEMTDEAYVRYGARLTEPGVTIDGKTVEGWYLDPEFTQPWSFANDRMPDHNITLYAKLTDSTELFDFDVVNNQAVITGYYGNASSVIIPAQINGYDVTKLAENSIVSSEITELTIPATVKTIAGGAINCENLYNITCLSDTYFTVHDDGVLYNADGTTLVYAPQGKEFLTYEVPDGVTKIYKRAFYGQHSMDSIIIPETVVGINEDAFEGNTMLNIFGSEDPDSASYKFAKKYGFTYNLYTVLYYYEGELVYAGKFEAGNLITDYYEPTDSFATFGGWYTDEALTDEWDFTTGIMPAHDLNLYMKWDSLFAINLYNGEVTITGYQGSAKAIIVPEELNGYPVTAIASGAFTKASITSVTIPDSVTSIEDGSIGANVKVIGNRGSAAQTYASENGLTFTRRKYVLSFDSMGGSAVTSLNVMAGNKATLPVPVRTNYKFMGWYKDTTYSDESKWTDDTVMPANDVQLCAYWKVVNTNISNDFAYAMLADGTVEITNYTGIKTTLTIPNKINGYTVSRIGVSAFSENTTLMTVTIPNTITSIGEYAFSNSAVRKVTGATKVEKIEECAFMGAASLSSVYISATVKEIGESAFMYCKGLTTVTLRQGTETIGNRAFYGCTFLDTVTIPASLKEIGIEAFGQCPRLTKLTVPNNLVKDAPKAVDGNTMITYQDSGNVRILNIEQGSGTIAILTWNKVASAAKYFVYRKKETDTKFRKLSPIYTETTVTISGNTLGTTIQYYVQAADENDEILCESEAVEVYMSPLQMPGIASVIQKSATSAIMTLNSVNDAKGYIIYRADAEEGPYTKLKTTSAVSVTNTGLTPGHDYYYKVRTYQSGEDGNVYSNYSDVYHFHMPYKYLTAPTGVAVRQISDHEAIALWDDEEGAEGYIVYRSVDDGEYEEAGTFTDVGYTADDLTAGQKFAVKVTAFFIDGTERYETAKSNAASLTMKAVPTPTLTEIIHNKTNSLTLTWSEVEGATGYVIYRSADGAAYVTLATVKKTTYTDTTVEAGKTYKYRIKAYAGTDGTEEYSNYSNILSYKVADVATVDGVKAVQNGSTKAKITWKTLTNVSEYEVWVSANNENQYELAQTVTTNSATLSDLKDGVTYYVKVRAGADKDGETVYGAYSDPAGVFILGTPAIEVCEQEGAKSVRVMWKKVESADGYEVWRKADDEEAYRLVRTQPIESYLNVGAIPGKLYSYKVRAYRNIEGVKSYGSYSTVKTVMALARPVITNIARTADTKVTVQWESVENATGYVLYMSETQDGVYTKKKTLTATESAVGGLTVGETYYFKVTPYYKNGSTTQYGKESVVQGVKLVEQPVITGAEKATDGAFTVTWNEIPGAAYYRVYMGTAEDQLTTSKKVTVPTAMFTGQEQNRRYYFQVIAYETVLDLTSESMPSATGSYYLSDLNRASISKFEQANETSVKVSWGAVSGAAGYEVYRSDTEDGEYALVSTLTGRTLTDQELTTGTEYWYRVRAYKTVSGEKVYGGFSAKQNLTIASAPVIIAEITARTRITVTWNASAGAQNYEVYRKVNSGSYELAETTTSTTYTDSACTTGNKYSYRVQAVFKPSVTHTGPKSAYKTVNFGSMSAITVTECKQTDGGTVTLTWNANAKAEGYEVWKSENNGEFVKAVTTSETSCEISKLNGGSTYRFKVRGYIVIDETKYYGVFSDPESKDVLVTPELTGMVQISSDSVALTWAAAYGANTYQVWRKTEGGADFKKVKNITTGETTWTDTGLETGVTYQYKIRAARAGDVIDVTWSPVKAVTLIEFSSDPYPESEHNYGNNMNQTWTYTIPGAESLALKFSSSTAFEANYDKLYITDKDGNAVGDQWYSGTTLAGKLIIVPGDTVNLRMTSDGSITKYGFSFDYIGVPAR